MTMRLKDFKFNNDDVKELECKQGLFGSYMKITFKENVVDGKQRDRKKIKENNKRM